MFTIPLFTIASLKEVTSPFLVIFFYIIPISTLRLKVTLGPWLIAIQSTLCLFTLKLKMGDTILHFYSEKNMNALGICNYCLYIAVTTCLAIYNNIPFDMHPLITSEQPRP